MAQYDLTDTLSKYLDRHLIFPLLEFLSEKQLYSDRDIQQGKIELLQNTNMVDYMIDIYTTLHNGKEAPKEMMTRREEVGLFAGLEIVDFLYNVTHETMYHTCLTVYT